MKIALRVFSLVIVALLFSVNTFGQQYDCQVESNQFRNNKDQWIIKTHNEPFSSADISAFQGLFYYPIDCKYVYSGKLQRNDPMKVVNVETSSGETVGLYDYGTLVVNIGNQKYRLKVYQNINMPDFKEAPGTIFVHFKDETAGAAINTTFASGRYLAIQPSAGNDPVILDFNQAANPFENYNSTFPSLVVPSENIILAPIQTGERKYEDR